MRAHRNTWGRVSQAQKRDLERDEEVWSFRSICGSSMDAGRCADEPWQFQCTAVFPPEDQSR